MKTLTAILALTTASLASTLDTTLASPLDTTLDRRFNDTVKPFLANHHGLTSARLWDFPSAERFWSQSAARSSASAGLFGPSKVTTPSDLYAAP